MRRFAPAGDGVVGLMVAGPLRPLHYRVPSPAPRYQPLRPSFTPVKSIHLSLSLSVSIFYSNKSTHIPTFARSLSLSLFLCSVGLPLYFFHPSSFHLFAPFSSFLSVDIISPIFFGSYSWSSFEWAKFLSTCSSSASGIRVRFPTGAHPLNSHSFVTVPDRRCDG